MVRPQILWNYENKWKALLFGGKLKKESFILFPQSSSKITEPLGTK